MRLALIAGLLTLASLGCSKPSPERLAEESASRAKDYRRDRAAIAKEGQELLLSGGCTEAAIIAAPDPDRHFLACHGFNTAAGDNPHLAEFRARVGTSDEAVAAACSDPNLRWPAVAGTFCRELKDRRIAKARGMRPDYEAAGRCGNAALRAAADPDADYFVCFGSRDLYPREIHLNDFRARYGPGLDAIRSRCPQIRSEIEADRKASSREPAAAGVDPSAPRWLGRAYGVFCTDEVPGNTLS